MILPASWELDEELLFGTSYKSNDRYSFFRLQKTAAMQVNTMITTAGGPDVVVVRRSWLGQDLQWFHIAVKVWGRMGIDRVHLLEDVAKGWIIEQVSNDHVLPYRASWKSAIVWFVSSAEPCSKEGYTTHCLLRRSRGNKTLTDSLDITRIPSGTTCSSRRLPYTK